MAAVDIIPKSKLYLYDLPEEITSSLELVQFDQSLDEQLESIKGNGVPSTNGQKIRIDDSDDLVKYNKKRQAKGLDAITEEQFGSMIERASLESISGSESEDESDDSSDEGLYERFTETSISDIAASENSTSYLHSKSPSIYFKSSLLHEGKNLAVYKSMFTQSELVNDPIKALESWSEKGKSALFMLGGGHFAGAIISHKRKNIKGNAPNPKISLQEQKVEVIKSKTFHRYTTRRKQGGSQSANDNSKGNAKSVGANIRRYMEQALASEIRELLLAWEADLKDCQNIFIRANASSGRKILVGYEGSPLQGNDKRIKGFPFSTKRATNSELKRAWVQLAYVRVENSIKEDEKEKLRLIKQQESLKKSQIQKQEAKKELSEDEKHTNELISFAKKQKAPLLINYLKKSKLTPQFELSPKDRYKQTPTILHYAAAQGLSHIVQVLLVNLKADPTIRNDAERVAAELSLNTQVKNAFQISRSKLGEEVWDWDAAKVGPPKTKEEFEKESEEEGERIKEQKRLQIQEELNRKTELELKQPTYSSKGLVGGANLLSSTSGLTDEQKLRVMREQRARAAEARFKKLSS